MWTAVKNPAEKFSVRWNAIYIFLRGRAGNSYRSFHFQKTLRIKEIAHCFFQQSTLAQIFYLRRNKNRPGSIFRSGIEAAA